MMEIKQVYLKTRAEFGKQCIFDMYGPHMDEEIKPNPDEMANYIVKTHCNADVQNTKQFALHEAQTVGAQTKSSGMFHFEGGWPKEINPRDEETTARFRRRVEKDEDWAPKLRNLFQQMEHNILQNGALNIYQHYFDDMIPTELVKERSLRTVNVYEDPQTPARSVNDISWSPDSSNKIVVSYLSLESNIKQDYNHIVYIWQIDNPNKPWMTLTAPCATMVSEFNPRDPSILASGLTSGQVCSWDVRIGTTPVQTSHRQFSHRDCARVVKWITTKSNTEFFSGSSDGRAMWWDIRKLRAPTEILLFDLQTPNEPQIDQAIGISSGDFEPSVSAKFMFGLENGIVISGVRKARTPAEKLALRFNAHFGPVTTVDRSSFNPKIFLTVGDCTARVWTEDSKDDNLVSTRFIKEGPIGGCWNKTRHSLFYVTTNAGVLTVWDLLMGLHEPILAVKLCDERLTAIAAHETGALLAVGNSAGKVYLVESTEALYSFDKSDRNDLTSYLENCSRFVKAIDTRLKEIKLARTAMEQVSDVTLDELKDKKREKRSTIDREKRKTYEKLKEKDRREKSRILSKKKIKDEFPELHEIEERFFEIVKKEKHKYEDDDVDMMPLKITRSMKKLIGRKTEKEPILLIEEPKVTDEPTISPQKIPKKAEITVSKIAPVQVDEEFKAIEEKPEETLPPPTEPVIETPVKEISKRKRKRKRKKRRKSRPRRVAFRLSRPCKVGVCKPDICCRRIAFRKLRTRFADQAVKDGEKWIRDEIRERTSIEGKDKMRRTKMWSWTTLLRAYKREKPTTKCNKKERMRFLQETMALREEFAEDVRRAKREIQEITRDSKATTKTRKLAEKAAESNATTTEKSRDTPRGSERDDDRDRAKEVMSTAKRIVATRKARKVCRAALMMDPCAPWKPPSLAQDLHTLLRGPLLESIEEKTRPRMAYLKEIEAARRDYPRISDFHSIE